MRKLLIIALLMILPLFADHDEEYERHFPGDFSYLHLSPAQQQSLKEAILEYQRRIAELYERQERLERGLKELFLRERFDKEAYIDRVCELKKEILKAQADFYARLHTILSPKQRERFLDYFREWEIE